MITESKLPPSPPCVAAREEKKKSGRENCRNVYERDIQIKQELKGVVIQGGDHQKRGTKVLL